MNTNELSAAHISTNLSDARYRLSCARARYETLKGKDRRMAAEDIEFYGNKVAFLSAWLKKAAA